MSTADLVLGVSFGEMDSPMSGERDSSHQWCRKHWDQVRAGMPATNGLLAALLLNQRALADERFMREAGWNPETGALADADRINEVLEKFSPICCFMGDGVIEEVIAEATNPKGGA